MITVPETASDDDEALDWLRMTSRILAGDIAPQEARAILGAHAATHDAPIRDPPLPAKLS